MLTMAYPSPLVYTQLGVTLVGVRKDLCMIDYLTPGIHYLTPQPGSGKSTNTIQFLLKNKNLKALIISNNHNLFDSTYGILLNEAYSVHYQGWSRLCLKFDENIPQINAKKDNPLIGPNRVCKCCSNEEQKKCPYHTQKNELENARIVATVPILAFIVLNNFKPDVVIIDENSTYNEEFIFVKEDVNNCLDHLMDEYIKLNEDSITYPDDYDLGSIPELIKKDHSRIKLFNDININGEYIDKKGVFSADGMLYQWMINYPGGSYLDTELVSFYSDVWNQVFNYALENYNKSKKYSNLIKELLRIEPYKIKGFLRRHIRYKTPTNIYLDPYEYKIFNWVKEEKFPVIMLDASFNDKRFVTFYHNWCEENNYSTYRNGNLKINVYTSDIRKPEISITHVNPNSKFFHPKESLEIYKNPTYKKYYSGLQEAIKKIKNAGYSVAIATNNKTEKMCFRGWGILTMHYNNLRGLNVAENVDYFFVFETPQQPVESKFYHSEKNGYGYQEIGLKDRFIGLFKKVPEFHSKKQLIKNSNGYYYDRGTRSETNPLGERVRKANIHANTIEKDRSGWTFDEELEFKIHEEIYQAIHRARPLLNDRTKIFVLGTMPEKIYREFTVEKMEWDDFTKSWDDKKITAKMFQHKIIDMIENNFHKNEDLETKLEKICEECGYVKKYERHTRPNTSFLKAFLSIGYMDIDKLDNIEKEIKRKKSLRIQNKRYIRKKKKCDFGESYVTDNFPGIKLKGRYRFENFIEDYMFYKKLENKG